MYLLPPGKCPIRRPRADRAHRTVNLTQSGLFPFTYKDGIFRRRLHENKNFPKIFIEKNEALFKAGRRGSNMKKSTPRRARETARNRRNRPLCRAQTNARAEKNRYPLAPSRIAPRHPPVRTPPHVAPRHPRTPHHTPRPVQRYTASSAGITAQARQTLPHRTCRLARTANTFTSHVASPRAAQAFLSRDHIRTAHTSRKSPLRAFGKRKPPHRRPRAGGQKILDNARNL